MISWEDYTNLSPIRTYEMYLERDRLIDELYTKIGELEDELEKEMR